MTEKKIKLNTITLAYFSGTGCTEAIAKSFENQLIERGICVNTVKISSSSVNEAVKSDLLIIFSPVYAFRLSHIVEDWTKNLPITENTSAAVISVSGGGDISPNTACRVKCNRILIRKGYNLIYEKMLVMPSNFAIQAEQQLNLELIKIMPLKVKQIITDILSGKENITYPKLQDRFFALIGCMEHFGARTFGASICASNKCNQCGLCIQNCPKKNIRIQNGKLKFGFRCMWCLKCIYACPQKALSPRILKFAVLKDGFDLKMMSKKAYQHEREEGYKPSRNILWNGVIKYLDE